MEYIEQKFAGKNVPFLKPKDPKEVLKVQTLLDTWSSIDLDALTIGSYVHLDTQGRRRYPFNLPAFQEKIETHAIKKTYQIIKAIGNHPQYAYPLSQALQCYEGKRRIWSDRQAFESLLDKTRNFLDECNKSLQFDNNYESSWLCSPDLSMADIAVGLLLHRLSLIGLSNLWQEHQKIELYYLRVQMLECFDVSTAWVVDQRSSFRGILRFFLSMWTWLSFATGLGIGFYFQKTGQDLL